MTRLTVKQCKDAQRRCKDGCGSKHPYKGQYHFYGILEYPLPDLPDGYQWVNIPTWGPHIRQANDLDYMADL